MRAELAHSLRYIREEAAGALPFDDVAFSRLTAELEDGVRYGPTLFADYYDLAEALVADDLEAACTALDALMQSRSPRPFNPAIPIGLRKDVLGATAERYKRMIEEDGQMDIGVVPPSDADVEDFRRRYDDAIALMAQAVPELHSEYAALVNELVLVSGDKTKPMQFDGGSHYRLWGALFLNVDFHKTPHAVIEVIAHEAGHSFLFGNCIEEGLTDNPEEERYKSPLRVDPRPMEGIYHATFVSARMHYAMDRLLQSGLLDAKAREDVRMAMDMDMKNFRDGYRVVAEHGRLTPVGDRLMTGALDYMNAAA
jgi:hypothetical protein